MHVHGPSHIHGPHGINAPHAPLRNQPAQSAPTIGGTDRVEISPAAQAASEAVDSGQVRQDLVNRIRAQIASGTYETPGKLGG